MEAKKNEGTTVGEKLPTLFFNWTDFGFSTNLFSLGVEKL